jgi:hypothetical protein
VTKHFCRNAWKVHLKRKEYLSVDMVSISNCRPTHRSPRQKLNEVVCFVQLLYVVFSLLLGVFGPTRNRKSLLQDQFSLA